MITEKDLQEAIAECQGVRNPNANTAIKLAAYYTIYDHLYGTPSDEGTPANGGETFEPYPAYSYAAEPAETEPVFGYYGGSKDADLDFAEAIEGKYVDDIMPVLAELMAVLHATQPRLYKAVLAKIE